ncbi:ABC transporter substrate-binding protein [Clostridium polynesiense]|uniref:ABC transporter substrate-binding protein n=1 Tax=Clostridium polynesiense TaxID=1325933 RepID=UPI00164D0BE9|nr:ABC transporter substrate-binding protein [Clostridium polynesiense]
MIKRVNKRVFSLILVSLMSVAALSGCGSKADNKGGKDNKGEMGTVTTGNKYNNAFIEGEKSTEKNVLSTVIEFEPPPSVQGNPYAKSGPNWSYLPLIYDYLADYSPLPERTFKPSLLEKYTYEDGLLDMTLKPGLKWSDGSDLTAEDVVNTFYMYLGRSPMWNYIEKVDVKDNNIKLKMKTKSELVLNMVFAIPISSPRKIYGKWADRYKEVIENYREIDPRTGNYVWPKAKEKITEINNDLLKYLPNLTEIPVSGPYYAKTVNTTEILFAVNENYRIKPEIEEIRGLREANTQTYSIAVLDKQFDIENAGLSPELHEEVVKKFKDEIRMFLSPAFASIGYSFNVNKYPTNIPEVRKAISNAINRETIAPISEPGSLVGDPKNSGLLPSIVSKFSDDNFYKSLDDHGYNLEKAEKHLKSIGWTRNKDGKWVDDKGQMPEIEIVVVGGWAAFMISGEAITTMLKEFGLNAIFRPMEEAAAWEYADSGKSHMVADFFGGVSTYNHPYESYNGLGYYGKRMGITSEPGKPQIFTNPVTKEEFNYTEKIAELFNAQGEEETKKVTQEFMKFYNDYVFNVSLIEKYRVTRVYDTKLSMAEAPVGEALKDFYWSSHLNNAIAKMVRDKKIYFVK